MYSCKLYYAVDIESSIYVTRTATIARISLLCMQRDKLNFHMQSYFRPLPPTSAVLGTLICLAGGALRQVRGTYYPSPKALAVSHIRCIAYLSLQVHASG